MIVGNSSDVQLVLIGWIGSILPSITCRHLTVAVHKWSGPLVAETVAT